ncbi:6294_t:CDS:1, partial [Racocetra persica]
MSTFNVPDFPSLAYKPYNQNSNKPYNQNSNNDDRILTTSEDSEYSARKLRQLDKISSENDYDYSVSNSEASEEIMLHRNASLRKLEAVTRVNSQRKLERDYSTRKLKQLDSFGPENDYDSSVTGGQLVTNYPYNTFNSEEVALNRNASLRKLGTANYQRKLASDSFKELQQPDQNRSTNAHNSIKRPVTAYEQFQL